MSIRALNSTQHAKWQPRCEFDHTLKGECCEKSGEVRLDGLLLCESHAQQLEAHERLGTMIGANRVAVTRAFGLLQDEGVVDLRRRLIYVRDLEALRRVAGYSEEAEERTP